VSNSTLKEAAGPVYGAFNLGDGLPAFALKNEAGEDIHTDKLADEKGVVIFLVPKADTRMFKSLAYYHPVL
jgi:peroxiredoxin